ncbi:ABC transporter ATP-binding protein [Pseudooceanicola algae]|uniref:Ribose import ATP-binding protein RbsA n=1 Tax=Pseudooceanicola algae TaxID=1537215 RepID=A0A418SC75_9RHOB|nr:ABC transporter ATP-binding protein [Pseudooceanicola algae]QPM90007.1 Ribose import ATP-binding protein RbsA [Pseudooceanicola algae]
MQDALRLCSVSKSFGGFRALDSVDFSVQPGEVHALLGENGAGKSTLMNIACGLYAPDEGHVEVDGKVVTIAGARDAAAMGIGMVHQHFKLVPAFSVLENILLFNPGRPAAEVARQAGEIAAKMGFDIDLSARAGLLGISEQQRVEILKVLVAGARVIILDEPTAVLSEDDGRALMSLVRGLAEGGSAVILVTHKLHEALEHSDRITVMRQGSKIAETRPAEMDRMRLTTLIVGESIVETPKPSKHVGGTRIRMNKLRFAGEGGRKGLVDVSFEVKDGEIYGIAGVSGNGQNELAELLMGLSIPSEGSIEIAGFGDVTRAGPAHRRRHGMASIPVDRYRHGLAGGIAISDNYAINGVLAGKYGGWGWFARKKARAAAAAAVETFDVQGARGTGQKAALLSGGNAQKLVIAREFEGEPRVILAHSPSRGLDVRAGAAVHDHLRRARDRGAAVILISEDLDEVLLLSDRIGVLTGGRLSAEFHAPTNRSDVGGAMVSHD